MKQRVITALILTAVAVALLAIGGVVLAAAIVAIICFAVYEEYSALQKAGHHPLSWPTWLGLALCVPLLAIGGAKLLIAVAIGVALLPSPASSSAASPSWRISSTAWCPLCPWCCPAWRCWR